MSGGLKQVIKELAGRLVAEYRINWIYVSTAPDKAARSAELTEVDEALCALLDKSPTLQVRKAARYARSGLKGLALCEQGKPVCVAHFAEPEQYDRAATWPLAQGEAALMDISTEEAARGKGHAVRLIRQASEYYLGRGYRRLIAFIWWSNQPSVRAFTKAGWKRAGLSIEVRRGPRWRSLRIPL